MRLLLAAAIAAFTLVGCSEGEVGSGSAPEAPTPVVVAEGWPASLSDWGQLAAGEGALVLGEGVTPYRLNVPLFSDYALKLRTVWLPDGSEPATYDAREVFDFPDGAVITKTFYYPREGEDLSRVSADGNELDHFWINQLDLTKVRLVETRILVRRGEEWDAASYVWNTDQSDAELARTGAFIDLTLISSSIPNQRLDYLVPNVNQCSNCHNTNTTDGMGTRPIGPKARHLNVDFDYADGRDFQLDRWTELGLLQDVPDDLQRRVGGFTVGPLSREQEARAYLDINCAHCHSRTGQADTSGLYLEPWEPTGPNLGICKPPIAAGRGTGNRQFGIVPGDADASIFTYRLESQRADVMMPELGRATVHHEGVVLIARWINEMSGGCG